MFACLAQMFYSEQFGLKNILVNFMVLSSVLLDFTIVNFQSLYCDFEQNSVSGLPPH